MTTASPQRGLSTRNRVRFIGKPLVFALSLAPFAWLVAATFGIAGLSLGANPVETLLEDFGTLGLRFTMFALAVTPLRRLTGFNWMAQFRRMIGLFAAFYVTLHFAVYLVLDQGLALAPVIEDIVKRPYITLGMIALVLLLAMTATSTLAARRRLGQRWQKLHNSVYLVGILGVWHFWWQVKSDITEPAIYAAVLTGLLGIRVYWRWQRQRRAKPPAPAASPQSAA
ncbi:MAG: protein-methionine-sulfoxide reductase heme-binding subunit MsrQ [Pseudomonadota bacterium]